MSTSPAVPATLAALLNELHQKQCVLGGWTAALSLSEAAVQRLLAGQWPAQTQLSLAWREPEGSGAVRLDLELELPGFALAGTGEAVTFRQPVCAATWRRGTVPTSSAPGAELDPNDPTAVWLAPGEFPVAEGAAMEGTIALRLRAEEAAPLTSIVALDLANAAVTLQGLGATGLAAGLLAALVTSALAGSRPYPPLASLDLSPGSEPTALQPASLQCHVAVTPSGARVLQLLIGGPAGAPATASIDVSEPVPTMDGAEFSLLVESSTVIQDVVQQFNAQTGLVKLVPINADAQITPNTAAYAQTRNPLQFNGIISCGNAIVPIVSSATMGMSFKGSRSGGLVVAGYAAPGGTTALQLSVAGSYPLQGSPTGELRFSAQPAAVTATGVAENTVKPRLESFLRNGVGPNMSNVTLPGPRVLLQRRLSLPGLQPKLTHAQLPGDLLLAGTLVALPAT